MGYLVINQALDKLNHRNIVTLPRIKFRKQPINELVRLRELEANSHL